MKIDLEKVNVTTGVMELSCDEDEYEDKVNFKSIFRIKKSNNTVSHKPVKVHQKSKS